MLLAAFVFRIGVGVLVAFVAGGTTALRHPLFLVYLALEGALSAVEGWHGRATAAHVRKLPRSVPAHEMPFVMSGKRYLFVRMLYHAAVVAWFARAAAVRPAALASMNVAGLLVMAAGVALRWWSMATLGERFRGFEAKREARGLETSGPYAVIRHPGYLALALTDLGAPLLLGVPAMVALWLGPATLILRQVAIEEPLLAANYPDEWPAYQARSSRLIPRVY